MSDSIYIKLRVKKARAFLAALIASLLTAKLLGLHGIHPYADGFASLAARFVDAQCFLGVIPHLSHSKRVSAHAHSFLKSRTGSPKTSDR